MKRTGKNRAHLEVGDELAARNGARGVVAAAEGRGERTVMIWVPTRGRR